MQGQDPVQQRKARDEAARELLNLRVHTTRTMRTISYTTCTLSVHVVCDCVSACACSARNSTGATGQEVTRESLRAGRRRAGRFVRLERTLLLPSHFGPLGLRSIRAERYSSRAPQLKQPSNFFDEKLLFVWRGVMVYVCIMHDQFQSFDSVSILTSWLTASYPKIYHFRRPFLTRKMVRQPTIRSQQHKLQRNNSNAIFQSGNSPLDLLALDISPSAGNYEPLQAMAKSGYLLASAQDHLSILCSRHCCAWLKVDT
jgi:hypothetical protein